MEKVICPAVGDEWEFVCEKALTHFCPYSYLAIGLDARRRNLPDCPDAPTCEEGKAENEKAQLGTQAGPQERLLRMEKRDLVNLILQYETRVKSPEQISPFIDQFMLEFRPQAQPGARIQEAER